MNYLHRQHAEKRSPLTPLPASRTNEGWLNFEWNQRYHVLCILFDFLFHEIYCFIETKLSPNCTMCMLVANYDSWLCINMHIILGAFVISYTSKFLKHIVPTCGQLVVGRQPSISRGASLGILEYCIILSTEIILLSTLHIFQMIVASCELRVNPYVTASPAMPVQHAHEISLRLTDLYDKYYQVKFR